MPPSPPASHLKKFLVEHKLLLKKDAKEAPTHLLLDGGKFALPEAAVGDFFAVYGRDLQLGRPLFVVERKSEVFLMHFDVDFPQLMDDERTLAFCDVLRGAVSEYFATPRRCVVCAVTDASKRERVGPGLHVIFPKTPVTEEQALRIRAGAVARCRQLLAWGGDEWDKVIDVCVLSSGGSLRLVGSDKCRPCDHCRNGREARLSCSRCADGHVPLGKVYWPWRVLPDDERAAGDLADLRANPAHAARVCSVRTLLALPDKEYRVPKGAPLPSRLARVPTDLGGTQRRLVYQENEGALHARNGAVVSLAPEVAAALQACVQRYSPAHAELVLKQTVKLNADKYVLKVTGFGSRHCLNKGDHHTSNNVFFVLHRSLGLTQRCFSKKPELRQGGCACQEFVGPSREVPLHLLEALFEGPPAQRRRCD
jgi:hypothetical protein